MGFWGSYLIARTDGPLAEHAAVTALGGDIDLTVGTGGGWQVVAVHAADPTETGGALAALLASTGAPALAAIVADSDFASVTARSPGGADWDTVVNPQGAASYGFPIAPADDAVVAAAAAWAEEAVGSPSDPAALRTALLTENVFAEESLQQLGRALGVWA